MQPASRFRHDTVVILCPELATGGSEALHQLGHAINTLGGRAVMAYFSRHSTIRMEEGLLQCRTQLAPAFQEHFSRYAPITEPAIPLTPRSLVIFPEVLAKAARGFRHSPRAIWWLSVDNAVVAEGAMKDPAVRARLFADESLQHYYQSCYAQAYLLAEGARQVIPLFDYVERSYRLTAEAAAAKAAAPGPRTIAVFPRKGAALAAPFIEANPGLNFLRIENMTREQVGQALAGSSVYIDFGHHPGKDRVPREAALAGNVVFLHEKGAGAHHGDYPVDRYYLFSEGEVQSGALLERVHAALADYPAHLSRQSPFLQRIVLEQPQFMMQVVSAFVEPA